MRSPLPTDGPAPAERGGTAGLVAAIARGVQCRSLPVPLLFGAGVVETDGRGSREPQLPEPLQQPPFAGPGLPRVWAVGPTPVPGASPGPGRGIRARS